MQEFKKDVFICYAREDKNEIVRPLVDAFHRKEISYWLDEGEILVGDLIAKKVNEVLRKSLYVLVVLSPAFLHKHFARAELDSALFEQASSGEVKVLPLLVGSDYVKTEILEQFPLFRHRSYILWEDSADDVIETVLRRLPCVQVPRPLEVCALSLQSIRRTWLEVLGVHVEQLTRALGGHVDVDVILPTPPVSK
jgi:hypothetical protein